MLETWNSLPLTCKLLYFGHAGGAGYGEYACPCLYISHAPTECICPHVVTIQEGIKVDWEDQLPYFDFAVRMPIA